MGVQTEIIIPRYVVLTRLADSWIPRASHGDVETAEAEAFRWRRIYGPARTRVAEFLVPEAVNQDAALPVLYEEVPAPVFDTAHSPVAFRSRRTLPAGSWAAQAINLQDAALRGLALYLGFGFADRVMDLLITLAQH
jgi:hypothetical protein